MNICNWVKEKLNIKRKSCNCGDVNCKAEVNATDSGKLYTVNFFTCGIVKNQIKQLSKIKIRNNG